jgi:flagellar motor protein MotB
MIELGIRPERLSISSWADNRLLEQAAELRYLNRRAEITIDRQCRPNCPDDFRDSGSSATR